MKLDTVTLEVIRNALPAVANEMAADLQRTSYNMMIYEVRDYCTALLGLKGELISQNVGGVSHFVADLGVLVVDGMQRYGRDGFKLGDTGSTSAAPRPVSARAQPSRTPGSKDCSSISSRSTRKASSTTPSIASSRTTSAFRSRRSAT
jgi:hypothetical protein